MSRHLVSSNVSLGMYGPNELRTTLILKPRLLALKYYGDYREKPHEIGFGKPLDIETRIVVPWVFHHSLAVRAMGFDEILSAAWRGDSGRVAALLGTGASLAHTEVLNDNPGRIGGDVDRMAGGVTPLHLAAAMGRLECATALIAAGANVRILTHDDSDVCSAAMLAARSTTAGSGDVMRVLIEAGADIGERSVEGLTLIMAACTSASVDKVSYLIAAGAPVTSMLSEGHRTMVTTGVRVEADTIIMKVIDVVDEFSEHMIIRMHRDASGVAHITKEWVHKPLSCVDLACPIQ